MSKLIPPHPFPARMSPDLALSVLEDAPKGAVVLDPMCGSGTALRAAGEHGLRAIGYDLDPLAVLMTQVWTNRIDTDLLRRSADQAVHRARNYDHRDIRLPWIDEDHETRRFVDYWFARPQQRQLRCLVRSVRKSPKSVRAALELAISRTIITKESGASLGRDISHSRPHRTKDANDFDVYEAFVQGARRIASQLSKEPPPGKVRAAVGDARRLTLRSQSVDLVLTSPPYLNAIDYMRGHRLALVWLRYTIAELRSIRSTSIGSERAPMPDADLSLAGELMNHLPGDVQELPSRLRRILERYLLDLHAVLIEIARVMKPGARAVFVIGNSCVNGVFVSNADALAAAASRCGLVPIRRFERHLPPNRRYLPPPTTQQSGALDLRMRSESVLTFTKPN